MSYKSYNWYDSLDDIKKSAPPKIKKLNPKKSFKYLDSKEDTVFVDRLGNILEKGSIVGFAYNGEIRIGVFGGQVEHLKTSEIYAGDWKGNYGWNQRFNLVQEIVNDLVFLTLSKKEKEVKHFLRFEENKINKYNKLCLIQKPTFYADDREVVAALMILDNLIEQGVIKSEKQEHKFLKSSDIESYDNLTEKEDAETEEVEK